MPSEYEKMLANNTHKTKKRGRETGKEQVSKVKVGYYCEREKERDIETKSQREMNSSWEDKKVQKKNLWCIMDNLKNEY